MSTKNIKAGDTVTVSFHGSQYTLCKGVVLYVPVATGDSWIIEEPGIGDPPFRSPGKIHHISEGCTITKEVFHSP